MPVNINTSLPKFLRMIAFCLIAPTGHAATFHINPEGGNDGFTGTEPIASGGTTGPWQSLGRLATTPLAPGDTVLLACGGAWNETLRISSSGTAQAPITIGAGPGTCATPPSINGAIPIPAHAWVQHSGSIYRARLPVDLIALPNPVSTLGPWTQWSSTGNATLAIDNNCPGQASPCMVLNSGSSNSLTASNMFPLSAGVQYAAGVQVWAAAGVKVKVVVRRAGPTYERLAPEKWITGNDAWQNAGFTFRSDTSLANARLDIEVPTLQARVHLREAHVQRTLPGGNVIATLASGIKTRRAHHPNFGQAGNPDSPYAAIASPGGRSLIDATGLVLPPGGSLAPGLGITIRTINWAIEERNVASVNGRVLSLSTPTDYDLQTGYGYFLTGALWMLDSPGEWFYNAPTQTFYIWMPDNAPPGDRVAITGLETGLDLGGTAFVTVEDIAISNVGSGVVTTRGNSILLSRIAITNTANFGISAENCQECSVAESSIFRTGLDAVNAVGPLTSRFSLTDSQIVDSGGSLRTDGWRMLPRPARAAAYAIGPQSNIARNSVIGAAKLGIYAGAGAQIVENYVSHSCLTHNDCGAIYAGRVGVGATIRGNVVDAVRGNVAGVPGAPQLRTVGIYLDDFNSDSMIIDNTVTGAEYGVQMHNVSYATVTGNTLFGNRRHQLWFHEDANQIRSAGDVFGNSIAANTLVPLASGPALYLESDVGDTPDFATFSGNHYSALLAQRVIGERNPTAGASYTVAEWQALGRESGARSTQPVGYASFLAGTQNLVPNGNLAQGIQGWTTWNQSPPYSTIAVGICNAAPCVSIQAGGSPTLLTSPNFSVTGGQWYRVSFDAATQSDGQPINVVVRRGGGGTAGYEYLMPAAESYAGSTAWRRYSFAFQAIKTINANDPVTQERGARVDFERNQPGYGLRVANLEMVALTAAQAALQVKLLINRDKVPASIDCESLNVAASICNSFVYLSDDSSVSWPAPVNALSSRPIYTRDTTLTDSDGDGIANQQDACPGTAPSLAVNARGCALGQ